MVTGNIVNETSDAIVSPTDRNLNNDRGIAKVIANAGGNAIKQECEKIISDKGQLKMGYSVSTSGGNL